MTRLGEKDTKMNKVVVVKGFTRPCWKHATRVYKIWCVGVRAILESKRRQVQTTSQGAYIAARGNAKECGRGIEATAGLELVWAVFKNRFNMARDQRLRRHIAQQLRVVLCPEVGTQRGKLCAPASAEASEAMESVNGGNCWKSRRTMLL